MNLQQIQQWRPDVVADVADVLITRRRQLSGFLDEIQSAAPPESWVGAAADAARERHEELVSGLADVVEHLSGVVSALDLATDAMRNLVEELEGACTFAVANECSVDLGTGTVTPLVAGAEPVRDATISRLEDVLANAASADAELAAVLDHAAAGIGATGSDLAGPGRDLPEPPPDGSERDNAAWWDDLSDAERQQVIDEHPEWIGNTDGVPGRARDEANRSLLPAHKAALAAEHAEAQEAALKSPYNTAAVIRAASLQKKLDGLDEIEKVIDRGDRQLLVLDPNGSELKAAVAVGDVDTADSVGVFTGGFTTNVRDSLTGHDSQMSELGQLAEAESLRTGGNKAVATVTWMGYDAPQADPGLVLPSRSVLSSSPAEAGAQELSSFLRGVDASRATPPHLVPMGHSYGSTVTGLALQQETGADAAVIFGSPGIGTEDTSALQVPDERMYMIEARRDLVADAGWFGPDPTHIDGVTGLSARDEVINGTTYAESVGHSAYLDSGSTSQYNVAQILADQPQEAVYDDGRGFGDWMSWRPW